MESSNAGMDQGNEGVGQQFFGSGLSEAVAPESTCDTDAPVSEEVLGESEAPVSEPESSQTQPESPEQQAFVGSDGQVHQIPPELIGPDGKMLPFTERTMAMLRNRYFTVRHVFLANCQHKLDMINQPKNNCDSCWFQFFNTHSTLVETARDFHQQYGKERLIAMRGKKFFVAFCRFMSTVHHILEEQKLKEQNDNQELGNLGDGVCREAGESGAVEAVNVGREVESSPVVNEVSQ